MEIAEVGFKASLQPGPALLQCQHPGMHLVGRITQDVVPRWEHFLIAAQLQERESHAIMHTPWAVHCQEEEPTPSIHHCLNIQSIVALPGVKLCRLGILCLSGTPYLDQDPVNSANYAAEYGMALTRQESSSGLGTGSLSH
eukprot:2682904-Rhodomonas_salina.1